MTIIGVTFLTATTQFLAGSAVVWLATSLARRILSRITRRTASSTDDVAYRLTSMVPLLARCVVVARMMRIALVLRCLALLVLPLLSPPVLCSHARLRNHCR